MKIRCHSILGILLGVAVQVTAETVTLSATHDATLFEQDQGTLADGSGQYLFVGRTEGPATRRALLTFDVTTHIPADATITSVTLTLNLSRTISTARTAPQTVERLGRGILRRWRPGRQGTTAATGDATWVHSFYDTHTWSTVGGDFEADASASRSVSAAGSYTWSSAGMVADVQAWLETPATDFGWMIRGDESASKTAKRFDSRQHSTVANRPLLTIEFDLPATHRHRLL